MTVAALLLVTSALAMLYTRDALRDLIQLLCFELNNADSAVLTVIES